jgi:lincosamide and streptogramin A transport system ATP-binding/permease protein
LTFGYEGSLYPVFQDVTFHIDTDWRLGFIGRNGRGKTTFLRLLRGELPFSGAITSAAVFDSFPFPILGMERVASDVVRELIAPFGAWETEMEACIQCGDEASLVRYGEVEALYSAHDGYVIDELIEREAGKLRVEPGALLRPFGTLSHGERVKLMLCALFLKKNRYLLIDEPTNHLDLEGRRAVAEYLAGKKGFLLVSHDRDFLDRCVDHVASINRDGIEVQRGDYSSWRENRARRDQYEQAEHDRLKKDVTRLQSAMARTAGWSDRIERSKIGDHAADRGFIGHQSAKMMKRAKAIEQRRGRAIEEKSQLLKNLEQAEPLKLHPLAPSRARLAEAEALGVCYGGKAVFSGLSFTLEAGERLALTGKNGCGKTSLLRLFLGEDVPHTGKFQLTGGAIVSYVRQDTSFLHGGLRAFAEQEKVDESLFKAILRKLDFSRALFEQEMQAYSDGQKKKVLLAASLCQSAHLYLWDEPLNYLDILSREQLEELILTYRPTMVFVEHDARFVEHIATKVLRL